MERRGLVGQTSAADRSGAGRAGDRGHPRCARERLRAAAFARIVGIDGKILRKGLEAAAAKIDGTRRPTGPSKRSKRGWPGSRRRSSRAILRGLGPEPLAAVEARVAEGLGDVQGVSDGGRRPDAPRADAPRGQAPRGPPAPDAPRGMRRMPAVRDLDVERVVPGGDGLARVDGRVALVDGGLPGDRVRAELAGAGPRLLRGRVLEVLSAGPHRRREAEVCPRARDGSCGGCDWPAARLESHRDLKTALVLDALRRVGGLTPDELPEPGWIGIAPELSAPEPAPSRARRAPRILRAAVRRRSRISRRARSSRSRSGRGSGRSGASSSRSGWPGESSRRWRIAKAASFWASCASIRGAARVLPR